MRSGQNPPHRLHKRISHNDGYIRTGITIRELSQSGEISRREIVWCIANVEFKHSSTRLELGEGDVDAFFESVWERWG